MICDFTNKAYLSAITVTNISKSFTHKMAAIINWYRYGTKLRYCYPMYTFMSRDAPARCIHKQGSNRPQTPPPVLPPVRLHQAHVIFLLLYIHRDMMS